MSKSNIHRQSFETGAVVLFLSAALVKIIGAIFKIPLSNLLGDTGFGYFSSAYDLFTPFYVLAMSGFPVASSKIISEYYALEKYSELHSYNKFAKRLFGFLGVLFTALFLLFIPFISSFVDITGQVKYALLAVAPSVLLFCIMSGYRGYFEGIHNMTPTAVSEVIEAVCKLILGYGFAFVTLKITKNYAFAAAAALLGITVGVAAATVFLAILYRKNVNSFTCIDFGKGTLAVKELRKNTVSLVISVAVTALLISVSSSLVDSLTVQPCLRISGSETEPIALYGIKSKAYTLYNLIPSLITVIGVSAIPSVTQAVAEKDDLALKKHICSLIKLSTVFAVPAGIGFLCLSKPIMNLLYDSTLSVSVGSRLLLIYGITAVFTGITIPIIYILQALGKHRNAVIILSVGTAIKIVANILLISNKKIGILGAAISTLIMFVFVAVSGTCLLFKTVKPNGIIFSLIKIFVASAICILANFLSEIFTSKLSVIVIIAVTVVLYFILIFALRLFSNEEIKDFPGGNKLLKLFKRC